MILLLLTACNLYLEDTKVHYDVPEELEGQVLFVTKGNEFFKASTKAPTTVTSNLDDGFNVAIDRNSSHNNLFIGEFSKDGQFWKGDCFWPNADQQYRFFAVYPKTYDLTYVSANSVGQGYTTHASTEDDIVCASLTNPDYKEVNELNFEHIFGKIVTVNITADEGYNINGCYVWLYPYTEGDYNLLSKTWSSKTESSERITLVNNKSVNSGLTYTEIINQNNQILLIPGKYVIHATWTANKSAYGYSEQFIDRQVIVDIPAGAASTLNVSFTGNAPVVQVSTNVENWTAHSIDETQIRTTDISGIGKFTINSSGDQIAFSPGLLMARLSEQIPLGTNIGYWLADDWKFCETQGFNYDSSNEAWNNLSASNINKYSFVSTYVGQDATYDSYGLVYLQYTTSNLPLLGHYYGIKTDFGQIPEVTSKVGVGWRTPSVEELNYILSNRETGISIEGFDEPNVSFTIARTRFRTKEGGNTVALGYLIFPDDFDGILPEGATINNVNFSGFSVANPSIGVQSTFTGTLSEISDSAMIELENKGCVFIVNGDKKYCLSDGLFHPKWSQYYSYYFFQYNSTNPVESAGSDYLVRLIKDVPKNNLFTVNNFGQKVNIAPGNLQYRASTNTWRFAEHQWDFIGTDNINASSSYSGWIDLFGWGTSGISGYSPIATCYQPWSDSNTDGDYNPYGSTYTHLYDGGENAGKADWGYNTIDNNGSPETGWRTPTDREWTYIINSRTGNNASTIGSTTNVRYTEATIRTDETGINGIILFPDGGEFKTNEFTTVGPLNNTSNWGTKCTAEQWTALEAKGCVFLPASGYHAGLNIVNIELSGNYWSSSYSTASQAKSFTFSNSISPYSPVARHLGYSVRLIKPQ